jgi:hypothetical protein
MAKMYESLYFELFFFRALNGHVFIVLHLGEVLPWLNILSSKA